jgi:ribonuclease P protein component
LIGEARREAHISTLPARAQAPSRLPFAHGHQERPQDRRPPSHPRSQASDGLGFSHTPPIERLRKRPDFLAAAKGVVAPRGAIVAQGRNRQDEAPLVRIGFTATRRIGGAVERNRAKRRLREAARLVAPDHVKAGCDYVFIARGGITRRPWPRLLDDVKSALIRLAADL